MKCLFYRAGSLWRRPPVGPETFIILSKFALLSHQADSVTHLAAGGGLGSHPGKKGSRAGAAPPAEQAPQDGRARPPPHRLMSPHARRPISAPVALSCYLAGTCACRAGRAGCERPSGRTSSTCARSPGRRALACPPCSCPPRAF